MKISRLLTIVCVNVCFAAPALATSQPAAGSSSPISLCGESKAKNDEKAEQTEASGEADKNAEKKTDKKDSKEKKTDGKASA